MFAKILTKLFGESEVAPAYFGLVLLALFIFGAGVAVGLLVG